MKLKKVLLMSITALMLLNTITPAYAKDDSKSKIIVKNEVMLSAAPYLLDDQVMIPVRSFAKSQGYTVVWNGNDRTDTISKGGKVLYKVQLNSDKAILNGKTYKLNNPVEKKDGKIFVDAEFLNLAHGVTIDRNSFDIMQYNYKFNKGAVGFEAIFSDYSYDQLGNYEIYEMKSAYKQIPVIGKESMGLYLASHNRSDDIFMGYEKKVSGLVPNKEYSLNIQFQLATNVESGGFGIGGSPSSSVYVKSGASTIKPESILDEKAGIYRMNIDTGVQGQGGEDMQVIGDVGKPEGSSITGFEYKQMQAEVKVVADDNGCVYLIIGTDSGFEGFTEYYIDNVTISLTK
ncbi:MAG: copper amine oxidase N-terminal domain-containing protein [Mobilitalea sp.]